MEFFVFFSFILRCIIGMFKERVGLEFGGMSSDGEVYLSLRGRFLSLLLS